MLALPHGAADTAGIARSPPVAHQRMARQVRRQVLRPRRSAPCPGRRRRAGSRTSCAGSGGRRRRRSPPGWSARPARSCWRRPCRPGRRARGRCRRSSRIVVLEHAVRRRVGDHQARPAGRGARAALPPQVGDVDVAVRRGRHDHHAHAGHRGAGRVGAVRRRRDQHDVAVRRRRARGDRRGSPSARRTRPARRSSAAATPPQSR